MWDLVLCYCCSVAMSCLTLCNLMNYSTPGSPVHHLHLPELAQTHVHRVGEAIQPSRPVVSSLSPSIFPSISVFSNESALCIGWPEYWSFSFSICPSNKTREEQSRNNSAALGQGPDSTSRDTCNNIFESFYRANSPNKWKILAFFGLPRWC